MFARVQYAPTIKKRNGEVVPFDADKIKNAIRKANNTIEDERMTAVTLDFLTEQICLRAGDVEPTVEQIQDLVEEQLIEMGYAKTAKAYILYRAEHAKIRQAEMDLMDIYKELTFRDAKDADFMRENNIARVSDLVGTVEPW